MKVFTLLLTPIFLLICPMTNYAQMSMFVKIVDNNADIYYMPDVDNPADIGRLTTHSGIDNHPDFYIKTTPPYDTMVVWSSNRL